MSDEITPTTSISTTSGGVNVAGDQIAIGGDVVGRDKIVQGYTAGEVRALLDQISTTFQPRPFDGRCPYLGLASYDEDTADLFFGRERIVTELIDRVREARWVFVTGPSGSGKSSLVRAGLIHDLKHNALPDSECWLYEALKPGRDPLTELARVASSLAGTLTAGEDIRTKGQTDPTILYQWAEIALKDKRDRRAVILVDQFEETFTQVAREVERVAFLNLLTYAATVEGGRVTLVFAMRSDFVSNCAAYPQLNDLLNQQFMQIGVMTPAELVSAIAQPALRVGLKVEPELVTQIIADMKGEPGALPLVQFALRDLFEAQQAQGALSGVNALTLRDYLARGGIHKALERHADSVFAQLSESEQSIARAVFSGLIQVGRGAEDTRRTALFDELVPADAASSQVEVVVGKLADARLIITDERDGRDIVTIAHEKLIDAWPWLRKLVNENRDSIALQNQIAEDAGEWEKNQRDASYLYIGARLANAREQLAAKKIKLNGLAQVFVTMGVEAEEANRAREAARIQKELDDARKLAESEKQRAEEQSRSAARLRRNAVYLIGALGVAVLLGIAAGVFGIQSNQNAEAAHRSAVTAEAASRLAIGSASTAQAESQIRATAEISANLQRDEAQRQFQIALSRQLAAQSLTTRDQQIDLALLLGVEAWRAGQTAEARNSLFSALQHSPGLITTVDVDKPIRQIAVSVDAQLLAVLACGADSTSPDYCQHGEVNVWDIADLQRPKLSAKLPIPPDKPNAIAFSPASTTSRLLAVAGGYRSNLGSNALSLWDLTQTDSPVQLSVFTASVPTAAVDIWGVAFSADGTRLAAVEHYPSYAFIRLWDVAQPKSPLLLDSFETNPDINRLAFTPDGKRLLGANDNGNVLLWEVVDGRTLTLGGITSPASSSFGAGWIWDIAVAPNGQYAVTGAADGIGLWNLSGTITMPNSIDHIELSGQVKSVAIDPSGQQVVASTCIQNDAVNVCRQSEIRRYDVRRGLVAPDQMLPALIGHAADIRSLDFVGRDRLISSDSTGQIMAWAVLTPEVPIKLGLLPETVLPPWNTVRADGAVMALPGEGNSITLWDVSHPPTRIPIGQPFSDHVYALAFNAVGNVLAAARGVYGGREVVVELWDTTNASQPIRLSAIDTNASAVAFSLDGRLIATGSTTGTLTVWDVSNLTAPIQIATAQPAHQGAVKTLAFAPGSRVFASAGEDQQLRFWQVIDLKSITPLGTPTAGFSRIPASLAFSPDGRLLAAGDEGSYITLWDVTNLRAPLQLGEPVNVGVSVTGIYADRDARQNRVVNKLAFTRDSQTLIAAWPVATSDGRTVDDTPKQFNVDPAQWIASACRIAGRNLSRAEWAQYLGDRPYRATCDQWP